MGESYFEKHSVVPAGSRVSLMSASMFRRRNRAWRGHVLMIGLRPYSSGFHSRDAVRAHAHLLPSLFLPCRTCFAACAGCPVGPSAGFQGFALLLFREVGLPACPVDTAMRANLNRICAAGRRPVQQSQLYDRRFRHLRVSINATELPCSR